MQKINEHFCPLCKNPGVPFFNTDFYSCSVCFGIFRPSNSLPDAEKEKSRYEKHQNDTNDIGYLNFTSPITEAILAEFTPYQSGLDFGSGPSSAISETLLKNNYDVKEYDPFFADDSKLLENKYDYIICCEVIEHFHHPEKEFQLLKNLLKAKGKIYAMTHIYDDSIDFANWYYKNDFTHVFFYRRETIKWIKEKFDFSTVTIRERLIVWSK